jgi:hypothetical protein
MKLNNVREYTRNLPLHALAKQRGISQIQIAIGIAVAGLALVGGLILIKYPEKMKSTNEMTEISDLRSSSVTYATNHGGLYTGMTLDLACKHGFFPDGRCNGTGAGTTVSNQWGGSVTVGIVTINAGNDGLKWTYSGLSNQTCIDQISTMWNVMAKIDVGSTAVKTASNQALDDATAATACSGAGNNASISWTIGTR